MKNALYLLIVVLVLAGILIAARPAWLYEGVAGNSTFIGGPVIGIALFFIFLIAVMAALQYFRNRMR